MTQALIGLLQPTAQLRWVIGTVEAVDLTAHSVTVAYQGVGVPHVGYLASYAPVVGDKVHCLLQEPNGLLVLGKQDPGAEEALPAVDPPVLAAPQTIAVYDTILGLWTVGGKVIQSPTKAGAWFYPEDSLTSLTGPWAKLEIEVTPEPTVAEPLAFVLHSNLAPSGPYIGAGVPELRVVTPAETTWVALPLAWADVLVSGVSTGIGLKHSAYSAAVSGGTLRFTPL